MQALTKAAVAKLAKNQLDDCEDGSWKSLGARSMQSNGCREDEAADSADAEELDLDPAFGVRVNQTLAWLYTVCSPRTNPYR